MDCQPPPISINGLLVALVLAGANTLFTGLNRAFGGIATLGWQGSTEFLEVISEHNYLIQDNHNRFLGGVWAAIGLMLIIAPLDLRLDDLWGLGRSRGLLRRRAGAREAGQCDAAQKKYVKPTVHSSISSLSSRLVKTT